MNDYAFGNFLYELRTEKGLSQSELGRLVGATNKAVSKWEMGAAKPRPETLAKLAGIFGVTIEELLCGKRREKAEGEMGGEEIAFAIDVLIREYRRAKKWFVVGLVCLIVPPVCMLAVLFVAYAMEAVESVWAAVLLGIFAPVHAVGEVTTIVSLVLMVKRKRTLYAIFPRRREEVSARSHTVPPAKERGKLGICVFFGLFFPLAVLAIALYGTGVIGGTAVAFLAAGGALALGIGNTLFTQLWLRRVNRSLGAGQFEKARKEGKFLLEKWLPDARAPLCDACRVCIAVASFGLYDDAAFYDYLREITVRYYLPAKSYWTCVAALAAGDKAAFEREYQTVFLPLAGDRRVRRTAPLYGERLRLFAALTAGTAPEGTKETLLSLTTNPRVHEIVRALPGAPALPVQKP